MRRSAIRAVTPVSRQRPSQQTFSTSSCCRDSTSEAESSTASHRPAKGQAYTGENSRDAFRRNIKEVQAFRRQKDVLRVKNPFIPASDRKIPPPPPPKTPTALALSTLTATGAALGCSVTTMNKTFGPFVLGKRAGLSIIDLDQTLPILRRTAALVRDVVKADGVVLFVGTRPGQKRALELARHRMGDNGFYTQKWLPGLLTNTETFFGLQPLAQRSHLPDLVVFLNPADHFNAVRECTGRNIPSVGVIDSNTDPRLVTYPIPANAQSIRFSELVIGTLSLAGQEGRRLRLKETEDQQRKYRQRYAEATEENDRASAGPDS